MTSSVRLRRLPHSLRRLRCEPDGSYLTRLLDAQHIPTSLQPSYIRQLEREHPAVSNLVEALSGNPAHPLSAADAHLADCETCRATMPDRWVCRRCASGACIQQMPHAGSFVCRRHKMWIGPGTTPDEQHIASPIALMADRRWQLLLARGRANTVIGVEVDELLKDWAAQVGLALQAEDRFVIMVRCWERIVAETTLEAITRPDRAFSDAHDHVERIVGSAMPDAGQLAPIVDGLWALVRPTALLRRTDLAPGGVTQHDGRHVVSIGPTERKASGPLQPFEHYYRPVTTSRHDRWQSFLQRYGVDNPRGGYRWVATKGRSSELVLACPRGHRMSGTANARHNSFKSTALGCAVCSGRIALAGYHSLADSGRLLAATWHPTKNGNLTPCDVTPGAAQKVWWVCAKGHDFESPVYIIGAMQLGCPVCRGYRVIPGVNDLATLSPDVAAQWHPDRNGENSPQAVTAGSGRSVWWRCEFGHEWQAVIAKRKNRGCPTCSNSRVDAAVNSLQAKNPELAAELHSSRNGSHTSTTLGAGAGTKVWWRCAEGHEWVASVANRRRGRGCPYCRNRRAWPGFNDAHARHPELMIDWDWMRNLDFDPTSRLPGTKKHWWRCATAGHQALETFSNRKATGGCPRCPASERVARGA